MKADDVKPGMRNLDLELKVVDMEEPHTFEKKGKQGKVVTAVCEDDSGRVKVSLWDEDVDRVETGDRIRVEGGYSRLFKGELRVSAGRHGEIVVLT
ncbi:hypothetical protein AKJ57_02890 [candidate division MSBL1 archaeon SCGC-AAA259A05]|uniref:Single-stranded DNA binding protein Ssb-like OB fold domain-containing protein n=1 Tax=candidate division MSBL1 archaeon SCGC-AAA259A05 TaxID=1698259 RepID=A0A133U9Y8_9EURY|nr:hypothetical protein AKJ57_02890 [candidate division MSBL1 archaeon SCGC-AAA259A05]